MDTFTLFSELNIPEPLKEALEEMGFTEPTPIQAQAIPPALTRKDILGLAQTGTGQTAAFGIPLLTTLYYDQKISALVLAPTRELAAQIHKVLKTMGGSGMKLKGALLVGGESFKRQKDELQKGVDYIVATPGRLIDHLQQETLRLRSVGILVLDEVDRMLDMGFLPQVRNILQHVPATRQTMIFSATLPGEIDALANGCLKDPVKISIEHTETSLALVTQETIKTTHLRKPDVLVEQLQKCEGRVLVFARTQVGAERVARFIGRHNIDAVLLHGGRHQSDRKKALESFRLGKPRIMVATDLAGRGIDIEDIEMVINYDMPGTREDYVHRIGRTGRAGKTGIAVSLVTPEDIDATKIIGGVKGLSRKVFSSRKWRR